MVFGDPATRAAGITQLEIVIESMVECVETEGGQAIHFTGDGILAVFPACGNGGDANASGMGESDAAGSALAAVAGIQNVTAQAAERHAEECNKRFEAGGGEHCPEPLTQYRFSVHFGRFQATTLWFAMDPLLIGMDVVITARMLERVLWIEDSTM